VPELLSIHINGGGGGLITQIVDYDYGATICVL
jgi:hypothetical protein